MESRFDIKNFRNVSVTLFKINDKEYRWRGLFGSVLESIESEKIKEKEVRYICGIPFEVFSVCKHRKLLLIISYYEVHWVPVITVDIDWIRAFKSSLLLASET